MHSLIKIRSNEYATLIHSIGSDGFNKEGYCFISNREPNIKGWRDKNYGLIQYPLHKDKDKDKDIIVWVKIFCYSIGLDS